MAKHDMVDEKDKGVDDDAFKGNSDGRPVNGPTSSKPGDYGSKRLGSVNGGEYRSSITDNPGSQPYSGGTNKGKGSTKQDSHGDASLYSEESNDGVGDEHQESAGDKDVDDYYGELSERRPPNYSKNANLQTKQAPLDLAPVDGGDGFIGSNTGPAVNFAYITGKKGMTEDVPVWEHQTTHTDMQDNSGSANPKDIPHEEFDRDEFADWKHVETKADLPITHYTKDSNDGVPDANRDARDSGGGNPDTQSIPGVESGESDTPEMPTTERTFAAGDGVPVFKPYRNQHKEDASDLYSPEPHE